MTADESLRHHLSLVEDHVKILLPGLTEDEYEDLDVEANWNDFGRRYYVASIRSKLTGKLLWPTSNS